MALYSNIETPVNFAEAVHCIIRGMEEVVAFPHGELINQRNYFTGELKPRRVVSRKGLTAIRVSEAIAKAYYHAEHKDELYPQNNWAASAKLSAPMIRLKNNPDSFQYDHALRYALLYEDQSILVCPGSALWYDDFLGHFGVQSPGSHYDRLGLFGSLIEMEDYYASLEPFRDLFASKRFLVMPSVVASCTLNQMEEHETTVYRVPPTAQGAALNFGINEGALEDSRNSFLFEKFYLPYFPSLSMQNLASLAKDEGEAFRIFTQFFRNKILELTDLSSTEDIAHLLEGIEHEARKLQASARKMSRLSIISGEVGLFGVSLAAAVAGDASIFSTIAGVTGSVTLFDFLKEYRSYRNEKIDLRSNDFYIPYLLQRERSVLPN